MELSPEQDKALTAIADWVRSDRKVFVLGGYAGTGKTTLLRHVVEDYGGTCCTPTGKAAAVLASKLPEGATVKTLHSYLYTPDPPSEDRVKLLKQSMESLEQQIAEAQRMDVPDDEREAVVKRLTAELAEIRTQHDKEERRLILGEVDFHPRFDTLGELVIVDEASMVQEQVERDLLAVAGKVLFVGDPGQLPPVKSVDFFERHKPNVMLTEIHRQAADSAVLRLATAIRNDARGFDGWDESCRRVAPQEITIDEVLAHNQVITGMNVTRRSLNLQLRARLGFTGTFPMAGERLICLRNNHDLNIVNGVQASTTNAAREDQYRDDVLRLDLFYDGGRVLPNLPVSKYAFHLYQDPTRVRNWGDGSTDWDFGYAITCHKAQGSEWSSVLIYDDAMRTDNREQRKRWLYTAVTRAREKVTWVR